MEEAVAILICNECNQELESCECGHSFEPNEPISCDGDKHYCYSCSEFNE